MLTKKYCDDTVFCMMLSKEKETHYVIILQKKMM